MAGASGVGRSRAGDELEEEQREGGPLTADSVLDPGMRRHNPRAWVELSSKLSHLEDGKKR